MAEASRRPKDKNYNLIGVLYQASENVAPFEPCVQDAEQQGDQGLTGFEDVGRGRSRWRPRPRNQQSCLPAARPDFRLPLRGT